jgi:L-ascorbate metabolism protein UlaG (beta-lactamase superfamily)
VSQISDGESSAFLVRVEGLALYHGGDYQGGAERKKDYEWLAGTPGPVDVAFVDLGESVRATHLPALEVLRPRIVFPMHAGRMESVYQNVAREVEGQFPRIRFLCAKDRGDRFDCSRPE